MPTENGWAIVGKFGLYTGWWTTRQQAIEGHVRDKVVFGHSTNPVRDIWKYCRKDGDRAVKVSIKYELK